MNSNTSFIGQLDELAIWNSQRSLEEIRNDALEGIDENSESLEQYYEKLSHHIKLSLPPIKDL